MGPIPVIAIAALGLLAGSAVEGVVSSYHHHGGFGPWPCCRTCRHPRGGVAAIPLVGFVAARRCVACERRYGAHELTMQMATALTFAAVGCAGSRGHPCLHDALWQARYAQEEGDDAARGRDLRAGLEMGEGMTR